MAEQSPNLFRDIGDVVKEGTVERKCDEENLDTEDETGGIENEEAKEKREYRENLFDNGVTEMEVQFDNGVTQTLLLVIYFTPSAEFVHELRGEWRNPADADFHPLLS